VGQAFALGADALRLGREPRGRRCALVRLNDASVSRVHARIDARPGHCDLLLSDCGSANGVFVNGRSVKRHPLRAGDVVRLGDTVLVVGEGRAGADDGDDLGLVGGSRAIAELRALVRRAAPTQLPALIVGAAGTGKELVARALHLASGRRGPFVAVSGATLTAALAQADGGTLFIDEIADLGPEAGPELLRALDCPAAAASVRVVAATRAAPGGAGDRVREALHARLAGVVLRTPVLADRKEDIPGLVRRLLPGTGAPDAFDSDFVEALLLHPWPRNLRELQMLVERLVALYPGARFELGMLDEEMAEPVRHRRDGARADRSRRPASREELLALLDRCGGNVARLAKLVERNRKQVYRWMDDYRVERGSGRSR
jgi:DNA-binding NtrC family response regulator